MADQTDHEAAKPARKASGAGRSVSRRAPKAVKTAGKQAGAGGAGAGKGKRSNRRKSGQKGATGLARAGVVEALTPEVVRERLGFDELDAVDKVMLSAVCRNPSITDVELAVLVGLERKAVNRRRNRPAFQRVFEEDALDAWGIFVANQKEAARTMVRCLNADTEMVQFLSSKYMLDPLVKAKTEGGTVDQRLRDFAEVLEASYQERVASGVVKPVGSASTVQGTGA